MRCPSRCEMPNPVATGTYPGIEVAFYEKPYRHYTVNGEKAVSVTTAIGVLNKPLDSWVERTTLGGAWKLLHKSNYELPENREPETCPWRTRKYVPNFARKCDIPAHNCVGGDPALCQFRVDLKNRHLDFYAEKKEAAERGVDVHQIWQDWNEKQTIPNAAAYPHNRRGFIRGLAKFIMDHSPQCVESEKVVGSAIYGFAGRLDTVVILDLDGQSSMIDLKTASGVWRNSMFPQLAGYEIARRECGLTPTTRQGILRLDKNGTYEGPVWSDAVAKDFLTILQTHKSQERWARR